jgi:effector-binding domain-containing protein
MGIRDRLPVCSQIRQLHMELNQYLQEQQIETTGFWQSLWYDSEFEHENVDAEAVVPICDASMRKSSKFLAAHARIKQYSLPAAQMACVIHQGSYSTIVQAFNALLQWIEINYYQIAGANREVYLHPNLLNANFIADPTADHAIIEIQFPVRENV